MEKQRRNTILTAGEIRSRDPNVAEYPQMHTFLARWKLVLECGLNLIVDLGDKLIQQSGQLPLDGWYLNVISGLGSRCHCRVFGLEALVGASQTQVAEQRGWSIPLRWPYAPRAIALALWQDLGTLQDGLAPRSTSTGSVP